MKVVFGGSFFAGAAVTDCATGCATVILRFLLFGAIAGGRQSAVDVDVVCEMVEDALAVSALRKVRKR